MNNLRSLTKQALLWVCVKVCGIIAFVVDTVVEVIELGKEMTNIAADGIIKAVQRVRASKVVQTIGKGIHTCKKVIDAWKRIKDMKEFPDTVYNIGKGFWAFVTSKVCFSWAPSSGLCMVCSLGYAALLLAGFTFSLYLLGLVSTVFQS